MDLGGRRHVATARPASRGDRERDRCRAQRGGDRRWPRVPGRSEPPRGRRDQRRGGRRAVERAGGCCSSPDPSVRRRRPAPGRRTPAQAAQAARQRLPEPVAQRQTGPGRLDDGPRRRAGAAARRARHRVRGRPAAARRSSAPARPGEPDAQWRRPAVPRQEVLGHDPDDLRVGRRVLLGAEADRRRAWRRTCRDGRRGGRRWSGSSRSSARPRISPTSKSSSASPRASITDGWARRLRTFWAPGFEKTRSASPSHQNQIGTRCGPPSGRTVDSQTTGSLSRNPWMRVAATVVGCVSMPGGWAGVVPAAHRFPS